MIGNEGLLKNIGLKKMLKKPEKRNSLKKVAHKYSYLSYVRQE